MGSLAPAFVMPRTMPRRSNGRPRWRAISSADVASRSEAQAPVRIVKLQNLDNDVLVVIQRTLFAQALSADGVRLGSLAASCRSLHAALAPELRLQRKHAEAALLAHCQITAEELDKGGCLLDLSGWFERSGVLKTMLGSMLAHWRSGQTYFITAAHRYHGEVGSTRVSSTIQISVAWRVAEIYHANISATAACLQVRGSFTELLSLQSELWHHYTPPYYVVTQGGSTVRMML